MISEVPPACHWYEFIPVFHLGYNLKIIFIVDNGVLFFKDVSPWKHVLAKGGFFQIVSLSCFPDRFQLNLDIGVVLKARDINEVCLVILFVFLLGSSYK